MSLHPTTFNHAFVRRLYHSVRKTKRLLCVVYNPRVWTFKLTSYFPLFTFFILLSWQDLRLHLDPTGALLWGKLMYSFNGCREVIKSRNGPCLPTLCGKRGSKSSKMRTRYSTLYTKTYCNCTNLKSCSVCVLMEKLSSSVQNVLCSGMQLYYFIILFALRLNKNKKICPSIHYLNHLSF